MANTVTEGIPSSTSAISPAGSGSNGYPGATILVAASNSSARAKKVADFVCTGSNDDVVINTALALVGSLPTGGKVLLAEGTYVGGNTGIQMLAGRVSLYGLDFRDDTQLTLANGATPPAMITIGTAGTGNLFNNALKWLSLYGEGGASTVNGIIAASNLFRASDIYLEAIPQDAITLHSFISTEFALQRLMNIQGYNIGRDGLVTDVNIYDATFMDVVMGGTQGSTGRYGFNHAGQYLEHIGCRGHDFWLGHGARFIGSVGSKWIGGKLDENGGGAASAGNGFNGHGGVGMYCDANTRIAIQAGTFFAANDSYDIAFDSTSNSSISQTQHNGVSGASQANIYITGATGDTVDHAHIVDPVSYGIVSAFSNGLTIDHNEVTYPTTSPAAQSIRLFATTISMVDHNAVGNGISEENVVSNFNTFDRNPLIGGVVTLIGADSILVPALAGSPEVASNAELFNYLSMSSDPTKDWTSNIGSLAAGNPWGTKVPSVSKPITDIAMNVAVLGTGLSNCFAWVTDAAGNLLGTTADQSTVWNSTGLKIMALTTVIAKPPPGPLTVWWMYTGAALNFSGDNQPNQNVGLTAANGRSTVSASTGLTIVPATTVGSTIETFRAWAALR